MRTVGMILTMALAVAFGCAPNSSVDDDPSPKAAEASTRAKTFSLAGELPKKSVLPLTAASFCKGVENVFSQTKQDFKAEAAALCTGPTPTAFFTQILNEAVRGGSPTVRYLTEGNEGRGNVRLFLGYAMVVDKEPVTLLLGEEPYVATAADYEDRREGFKVQFKFVTPPVNEGDSDTAFRIVQYSERKGSQVNFEDTSEHDLKLYRMHPNNFDMLMAVRTLNSPTEQFKHAVALRGALAVEGEPGKSYGITVVNLLMNGRDQEDRMLEIVRRYVESDAAAVVEFHSN